MGTGEFNARGVEGRGNPTIDQHPIQGRMEIFLVASCYRNQDKLRVYELLGSHANLTSLTFSSFPVEQGLLMTIV